MPEGSVPSTAFSTNPNPRLILLRKYLLFIVPVAIVAAGAVYGYQTGWFNRLTGSAVQESNLPISTSFLTNPVVYEWQGSVAGEVVSKTDKDFTIKSGVSTLVVTFKKDYTKIFDGAHENGIPLAEIKVGTNIRGTVWFTSKTSTLDSKLPTISNEPNQAVGGIFHVEKAPTK